MIDEQLKNKFRIVLEEIISQSVTSRDEVPVLLSGGCDSTLVGFVLHSLGKKIVGISYELEGTINPDCLKSQNTCEEMGWKFEKVVVPTSNPEEDFLRLIREHNCEKKTELEILFPMIEMGKRIKQLGFSQVFSGFEGWLPDTRKFQIHLKDNPQSFWDYVINSNSLMSTGTNICLDYYKSIGIDIETPLDETEVIKVYSGLTHDDCHKPVWKYLLKSLYEDYFKKCGLWDDGISPNLQVGGKVEDYFSPLLSNPNINYKGYVKGNTTQRLSHLVQLWSKNPHPKITSTPLVIEYKPYKLEDVHKESSKELFTVVSTFGGGGGSSTGYKLGGGKILLMNEFIPEGVKTYQQNYPNTQIIESDIRKLTRVGGCKKLTEVFNSFGIQTGEYDILDGSPPCSTFSTAGKGKKKILEKNVKYSDTTQDRIGMLIHDFIFMANCTQPRICVMENVPSMMNSDVFQFGLVRLRRSFYINHSVMTASQFGVPQRRRRLIVIGVRKDIGKKVGIKKDEDILDLYPTGSIYEPTLNDSIRSLDIDKEERNVMLSSVVNSSIYELLRSLPKNPNKPIGMKSVDYTWTSDFNIVRSSWNQPSPTLTQTGQQISGLGGVFHPTEDRRFTLNELIRLMGLPDDFKLTGTHNQKIERVCRMVSPPIYQYLSKSLYEKVLSKV